MDTEAYNLALSIWGAGLSTVLAILTFMKFRKESKTSLWILGVSKLPFKELEINVCNKGQKPITIKELIIGLGRSKNSQTKLVKITYDNPIKLLESDVHFEYISRSKLQKELLAQRVGQKEFQLLWVTVHTTSGIRISSPIYIEPKIIHKDYYYKAEQFIATDLFLGFGQMNSNVYPIGINK